MAESKTDLSNNVGFCPESDDEGVREPAQIARDPRGDVVGVAIYLTAGDLRSLGINPSGVDAVVPRVVSGAVLVEPV